VQPEISAAPPTVQQLYLMENSEWLVLYFKQKFPFLAN
jgi:hypothetical protein